MAEPRNEWARPEYEETVDPKNPPEVFLHPAGEAMHPDVRGKAVWAYLGPVLASIVLVAIALVYWVTRNGPTERTGEPSSPIGTAGERTPGGFEPQPRPDSTREEIERRGGGPALQAPVAKTPLKTLSELQGNLAQHAIGRPIDVMNAKVASVDRSGVF